MLWIWSWRGRVPPTVLVYFRDRLEEKKAERVIFDAAVDLWWSWG